MLQPTITLTTEQIDFFHREGYLTLPAITTAAEVIRLQAIYDRLFATKAGRAEGDHLDLVTTDEDDQAPVLPQILNPAKYAPELLDTEYGAEIWSLYESGALRSGEELSGRFEHDDSAVDLRGVLREISDAQKEEAARLMRLQERT